MTGSIVVLRRATGSWKIPPEQVSEAAAGRLSDNDPKVERVARRHWLLAHISYGAVAGVLYSVVTQALGKLGPKSGLVFGLAVWTGSYVGYLPKWGIYPPPDRDLPSRVATMVIAHCVYGVTLGCVDKRLRSK